MTMLQVSDPSSVRAAFDRLAEIAMRGLPRMLSGGGQLFCHRALRRGDGELALEGTSERYTAMALIGVERWRRCGGETALALDPLYDGLAAWRDPSPGDQGLVLWALLERGDARAEATAAALLQRRDAVFDARSDFASMEMGFLLRGLAAGAGADLPGMAEFADETAAVLVQNQDPSTGLFSFGRAVRRKNFFRTRRDTRLGSFASQVYPTMALAALTAAGGDARWLAAAGKCAECIAALQGPEGQWWWVYHKAKAAPAICYPVYAVHQDAMGPMMLLAVALANGTPRRFDAAVQRSLAWFDSRPECRSEALIDADAGMVWRAVQRDDPATTGTLGLGGGELSRLGRAAWFGSSDRRPFVGGHVCPESRPYHLGWILLAAAMWIEATAAAGRT